MQILRVHLTEPRGDSFQLTFHQVIPNPHPDLWGIAVEPSRSAVITGIPGVGIEIYDWTRKRSVVAGTTGVSYRTMSVRTIHRYPLLDKTCSNAMTRNLPLAYVRWGIISCASDLSG